MHERDRHLAEAASPQRPTLSVLVGIDRDVSLFALGAGLLMERFTAGDATVLWRCHRRGCRIGTIIAAAGCCACPAGAYGRDSGLR